MTNLRYHALSNHLISLGNDGKLIEKGKFATTPDDINTKIKHMLESTRTWHKKRVMLYAHGGVVSEADAVKWADKQLKTFLDAEIYPFFFVWHSDPWSTFRSAVRRDIRSWLGFESFEANLQAKINQTSERLASALRHKTWLQMKHNASHATIHPQGGARLLIAELADKILNNTPLELHLTGHSAGGVFHAPLTQLIAASGFISTGQMRGQGGFGLKLKTVNLWAPGCTNEVFTTCYQPYLGNSVERFSLFTLPDQQELAEKMSLIGDLGYQGSILYLVSKAFEPVQDTPILGMAKWIEQDAALKSLLNQLNAWHLSGGPLSSAHTHGAFDDDLLTVTSTIKIMRGEL
ncbi:MAG: hypothetical protein KIH69_011705 [Anaerolineae bacterium]|nr:hypothetical protein [Anaerolineae bacterium]